MQILLGSDMETGLGSDMETGLGLKGKLVPK